MALIDASKWWEGRKKLGTITGAQLKSKMLKKTYMESMIMMMMMMASLRPKR